MNKIPSFRICAGLNVYFNALKDTFSNVSIKDGVEKHDFEKALAEFIGVKHAVVTPSGRIGLFLILKYLGLESGTEILVPAFTYWAVPRIISLSGLRPVFVDTSSSGCNMDISLIEQKISKKTKAIIATHLFGMPCRMDQISSLCSKYGLILIEDCAQACGASYKQQKAGSFGEAGFFSFGATKNLFLFGCGAVTTNNKELSQFLKNEISKYRILNRWALLKRLYGYLILNTATLNFVFSYFVFPLISLANRFGTDIVSRLFSEKGTASNNIPDGRPGIPSSRLIDKWGIPALSALSMENDKRIKNGLYLQEHIKDRQDISLLCRSQEDHRSIYMSFPVRAMDRKKLIRKLLSKGIDSSKGYMKAFGADCPKARQLEQEILHLPIYPSLKDDDLAYMAQVLE